MNFFYYVTWPVLQCNFRIYFFVKFYFVWGFGWVGGGGGELFKSENEMDSKSE